MINTINSLAGVDLDSWNTIPHVGGKGAHGGYCGPAVKPIALNMVANVQEIQELISLFLELEEFQTGKMQWNLC